MKLIGLYSVKGYEIVLFPENQNERNFIIKIDESKIEVKQDSEFKLTKIIIKEE